LGYLSTLNHYEESNGSFLEGSFFGQFIWVLIFELSKTDQKSEDARQKFRNYKVSFS
jgi:hypothetical protein